MKRAIGVILGVLALSYVTYRPVLPLEWPFVPWTTDSQKASKPFVVRYRRFLVHRADGSAVESDLGEPLRFLKKAYRVDAYVGRDLPAFLIASLKVMGEGVRGISYQTRRWVLAEDRHDTPYAFRVMKVPAKEARPARMNLLENGEFDAWDRAGNPRGWTHDEAWLGIGIDPTTGDRSLIVDSKMAVQDVEAPPGMLKLEAWARSEGGPVVLDLDGERSEECPRDGRWHRLEVTRLVTAPSKLRVTLAAGGGYDGVILSR